MIGEALSVSSGWWAEVGLVGVPTKTVISAIHGRVHQKEVQVGWR